MEVNVCLVFFVVSIFEIICEKQLWLICLGKQMRANFLWNKKFDAVHKIDGLKDKITPILRMFRN